jgi:arylsulfatase A-like enzyme
VTSETRRRAARGLHVTAACLAAAIAGPPRVAAAPAAPKPLGPRGERPNILFIYSDDQSYRTMSAYEGAYPWARTPHLDGLARRGVRFRSAYMPSWCMPSRAMLLTGKLPHAVESMRMEGKYPGSTYDSRRAPFWPRIFRQHGYVTAQIGKWHTGTDTGYGRDWDYQVVWNRPRYVDNAGSYYGEQLIEVNGGKAEIVKGYSTDNYTRWAVDFINGKHRDPKKPWYLWLCYGASHGPYTPAERHRGAYGDAAVTPPRDILPPRPGKPEYVQRLAAWERGPDGEPRLRKGQTYAAAIRQYNETVLALDEGIGRVLAALEKSGQLARTLVVFTADQGFAYGEHGFRHKLGPYDANIRPPFVVSMPGTIPQGAVVSAPVSGADLIPTFFRAAGIATPWKMHGRDLTPLLLDPRRAWNHPMLMVHTGKKYGSDTARIPPVPEIYDEAVPWWVLLREGRWKYIRTLVPGETEELYDLDADPDELVNLAAAPAQAATVKKLRAAAVSELRRLDAPFADHLPPVRPLPLALR